MEREELLKGIFVEKFNEVPPYTHRLVFLAEKVGLEMPSERTEGYLRRIGGLRRWLFKKVPSRKRSRITYKH